MISLPQHNKYSKGALFLCYALMIFTGFFYSPRWQKYSTEATIGWDVSGYYMYLPALFIYNDIKQIAFKDQLLATYKPTPNLQQAFLHEPSGNYVMKYPAGVAITMSPFFFAGHAIAKASTEYPADGYSFPYQVCIGVGMFLYALLGLFFLRKILLYYFSDSTVAILLIGLVFGSNYLSFSSVNQAMPHNPLFTIYVLLIYTTIKFYKRPAIGKAIAIGALTGMAALIRPTDAIAILIPLGWGISSVKDFTNRIAFIFRSLSLYLPAILVFAAIGSIQLIYWKLVSGHWVVYSYQDQGFSWLNPHIYDFSLSYKSGWLRYSPMLWFAFIGIIPFVWRGWNVLTIIGFFLLNFYIVTAWDVWDYGGTGGRAMMQSYPILAFPFAALIERVNMYRLLTFLFYPFFLLFIYLNFWWEFNTHTGGVIQVMTDRYYWNVVGKWEVDEFDRKLIENSHSYRGYPTEFDLVYENNFESDSSLNSTLYGENNKALFLDKEHQYTTKYYIPRSAVTGDWLRFSADFYPMQFEWETWNQTQFIVEFHKNGETVQHNMIRVQRFLNEGETKNVFLDAKVPEGEWDRIAIYLWNVDSEKRILIDNLKVISFKE